MINAIELDNVTFSYGHDQPYVLKNAGMTVCYGEIALLSGTSGEGKSTVISLVTGIAPNIVPGVFSGLVAVDGQNVSGKRVSEICRNVGVVLQNAEEQIIHRTVEEEIAFGCENMAYPVWEIEKRIDYACKLMSLSPSALASKLSGGQKQRLMTACALGTGQRILVLDEPLANLDRQGALLLMRTLKELAGEGYAVLIAEHRLDVIMPYVDSVWSIKDGRIIKARDKDSYLRENSLEIPDGLGLPKKRDMAIRANDVTYCAGNRAIIDGLNLELFRGERLLMLGENGSGKTTLMRLLAGLNKPQPGNIEQFIIPSKRAYIPADRRWFKEVGVVYQNPSYQLFMPTVEEEVAYGAKSRAYAEEMLKRFDIVHLRSRHPHSLSQGQKRRVSIAAVAASQPQILFLDEPTVGQDYAGLKSLTETLNQLHAETGGAVVTITHDIRCAAALCDRSVILKSGKIHESGGKELARRYLSGEV